eukprot:UN07886
MVFRTEKCDFKQNVSIYSNTQEFFAGPQDRRWYEKSIDIDGICVPGADVKKGTILINKFLQIQQSGMEPRRQAEPLKFQHKKQAKVDRVLFSQTVNLCFSKSSRRDTRVPTIGDKF